MCLHEQLEHIKYIYLTCKKTVLYMLISFWDPNRFHDIWKQLTVLSSQKIYETNYDAFLNCDEY